MAFFTGTSGYEYKFWGPCSPYVQNFYPTKSNHLRHYSAQLNSVEINATRYRRLKPKTCKKWKNTTPDEFHFTLKAPTYITHSKKLNGFREWWDGYQANIFELGEKFVCMLFQFPPAFKCTPANVAKLEVVQSIIPGDVDVAFEFRDTKWYDWKENKRLRSLFQAKNWAFVQLHVPEVRGESTNFGNLPGGVHRGVPRPDGGFEYYRFHGTISYSSGTYTSKVTSSLIRDDACRKRLCYFNNTDTWYHAPSGMEMLYTFLPRGLPHPSFICIRCNTSPKVVQYYTSVFVR